jgi:misacylated tRNA(Ala) deacylase
VHISQICKYDTRYLLAQPNKYNPYKHLPHHLQISKISKMTIPLFRDNAYLQTCQATVTAMNEQGIELDRTVFYPTGGGQPGDIGRLTLANGHSINIIDTRKGDLPGSIVHHISPGDARPAIGEIVTIQLDWERRYKLMRLHTALHVMSCVVIAPVTGGNMAVDKARLDFDIDMSLLVAADIEAKTNALIARATATETQWITDEEMASRPELIKTMSVKPPTGAGSVRLLSIPGIDLQPCGGTHVANISEIGAIKVTKIKSEGRQNKRVEIVLA